MFRSCRRCVLILCICFILLFAFLPRITAFLLDPNSGQNISYTALTTVQLRIREEDSVLGKLALFRDLDSTIEISKELTKLSPEQVEQIALDGVIPYIQKGLMNEFVPWSMEMRPILVHASQGSGLSGLIWSVAITGDPNGHISLSMDIDDATGRILRIQLIDSFWSRIDQEQCLAQFASIYFTSLGIMNYEEYRTDDLSTEYVGDDVCAVRYRFNDMDHGQINVDLYINTYGFYLEIPALLPQEVTK